MLAAMAVFLLAAIVTGILGSRAETGSQVHVMSSYRDCVQAGNPVQMSYPSVCITSDGQRFVNPDEQAPTGPVPL